MQSYLIVSQSENEADKKIKELIQAYSLKPVDQSIKGVDDMRNLRSFTKLKHQNKLGIIIRNLGEASPQALNAFLKNLEEPQENITFILTCKNEYNIIPTIQSRCQVIRLVGKNKGSRGNYKTLIKGNTAANLKILSNIKDRKEALDYMEGFIYECHSQLTKSKENLTKITKQVSAAQIARKKLLANGNIKLTLAHFVINLV